MNHPYENTPENKAIWRSFMDAIGDTRRRDNQWQTRASDKWVLAYRMYHMKTPTITCDKGTDPIHLDQGPMYPQAWNKLVIRLIRKYNKDVKRFNRKGYTQYIPDLGVQIPQVKEPLKLRFQ